MVVNFEGRPVEYDFGDLDELSLAYCCHHKSQGRSPVRSNPFPHPALHDAPAESALHGCDPWEEVGHARGDEEGPWDGRASSRYQPKVHGVEEAVGGTGNRFV